MSKLGDKPVFSLEGSGKDVDIPLMRLQSGKRGRETGS